jgi:GNAT superfamily N-acetyltransferase
MVTLENSNDQSSLTTNQINVRKATRPDYPALREVARLSRKKAFAHFMDDNEIAAEIEKYYSDNIMDEILASPSNAIFVAERAGNLLGYICVLPEDRKGRPRLLQFYVHPEAQRQGVGSLLFEYGCTFLKDAGKDEVFITTVRANNIGFAFFTKNGCQLIYNYESIWSGVSHEVTVFHRNL